MKTVLTDPDHSISLDKAIQMTKLYQAKKEKILDKSFAGKDILPISETFNRAAFDRVLAQPGCVRVRLYYAMDEALRLHAIFVGVGQNNEDILPGKASTESTATSTSDGDAPTPTDDGVIIEVGQRCPPDCLPTSPLNPK